MLVDWIRHTTLNIAPGICYGQTDVDVSQNFQQEARVVREKLKENSYDAVFSSPLQRARKLAEFCGFKDELILDDRLKEFNFGAWEMKSWEELFDFKENSIDEWFANWHQIPIPGAETLDAMVERIRHFVQEQQQRGYEHIACFCHGGVINCAQYLQGDISYDEVFRINPGYGELVRLEHSSQDKKRNG